MWEGVWMCECGRIFFYGNQKLSLTSAGILQPTSVSFATLPFNDSSIFVIGEPKPQGNWLCFHPQPHTAHTAVLHHTPWLLPPQRHDCTVFTTCTFHGLFSMWCSLILIYEWNYRPTTGKKSVLQVSILKNSSMCVRVCPATESLI